MRTEIVAILKKPNHPFFVGPVSKENFHANIPSSLPFILGIHPLYCVPQLIMTDEISSALSSAYSMGSMASTPLGESSLSTERMEEVIQKLLSLYHGDLTGKRILEIGCGNGELLNQLKKCGASVVGLEIGPQASIVEERYGIPVIKEPLKPGMLKEKFDCIFSYGCLEHIENIDEFFNASRDHLINGGLFLHVVPNFALSYDRLYIDQLSIEHVNYFTSGNGVPLFEAQGFVNAEGHPSKSGNELILWGFYDATANVHWPVERFGEEEQLLKSYAKKIDARFSKVMSVINGYLSKGLELGFYGGGFEYGFYCGPEAGIRYFDGDEFKHGKRWLISLPEIENPVRLPAQPVDKLIIFKPHYYEPIKKFLVSIGVSENALVNVAEI